MRTKLLPHNETAYKKVMKAFETSDRTCVVHPTGTGKSYLIAAVSESYKKVLILGPNTFVLDQVHNVLQWRKDGIEYMTYQMLLYTDNPKTDYDLICIDEFHRAGAPGWGDAVDHLLEVNPQAKVLGTTATPIRFLDDNRDMADELFEGNIASYMTLKDAWNRNILATPTFVTGLFEFDKLTDDMAERIRKSHRINAETKKQRLTRVNNLRLDWERSQGMPQIIRKHIDQQAKRIIVFCGNVDHLKDMEQTVRSWFQRAGFKIANIYTVHGYMPDKDLKTQMDGFEGDDFGEGGVKLMLSVNLLNEGVHIPRVNAVILLRTTSSKIIYLQQIGRCLTAANTDKPVILDMVDNITTTNLVHDIRDGFDWYEHQKPHEEKEHKNEPLPFVIYDYTLGIQDAINKLVPEEYSHASLEERLANIKTYCEEHGCLPSSRKADNIYRDYQWVNIRYPDNPEMLALKEKYAIKYSSIDEKLEQLNRFIKKNDRLPVRGDGDEYLNWQNILAYQRDYGDKRIDEIRKKYGVVKNNETVVRRLIEFVSSNKRLPSAGIKSPKEEIYLRADIVKRRLHLIDDRVKTLWEQYNKTPVKRSFGEKIINMQIYTEKYGRPPRHGEPERQQWESICFHCRDDERVIAMKEKYGGQGISEREVSCRALEVIDFIRKNGHAPSSSPKSADRPLYTQMINLRRNHLDNQDVQRMVQETELNPSVMSDEDLKRRIVEFVDKHHRLPSANSTGAPLDEVYLRTRWNARYDRLVEDPQMQAIADAYCRKTYNLEQSLTLVREFCNGNGRLPTKKDTGIYRDWTFLRENHLHVPSVRGLAEKYGYRHQSPRIDIEGILDAIKAFADRVGRLPSSAAKDKEEKKLGVRWSRLKRRYADNPKIIALMERFPIQNRR